MPPIVDAHAPCKRKSPSRTFQLFFCIHNCWCSAWRRLINFFFRLLPTRFTHTTVIDRFYFHFTVMHITRIDRSHTDNQAYTQSSRCGSNSLCFHFIQLFCSLLLCVVILSKLSYLVFTCSTISNAHNNYYYPIRPKSERHAVNIDKSRRTKDRHTAEEEEEEGEADEFHNKFKNAAKQKKLLRNTK